MKVAVIGAGIVGTLTAYELARLGYRVTVFDQEPGPAEKCSKANGGQISVCNAPTWNTWSNVWKGLKWMATPDAPLLIRPTPSLAKIKWLAGFLKHTLNGSHLENTKETIRIGNLSSARYKEIIQEENLQFDQSMCGLLHVYSSEKSIDDALKLTPVFEEQGVEWKYVSPEEVIGLDPALKTFTDLKGGILTSSDWTGDANLFCIALQKKLREKYAVRFFFNTKIARAKMRFVEWTRGDMGNLSQVESFGATVFCNGHDIVKFAAQHDDKLNIYPVKGYSITIPNVDANAPSISLLDDDRKIVTSKLGNRLRIAGTAELADGDDTIRDDRILPLVKWCNENFPQVDTTAYTPWACLRPMNSNMMPIVKQSKSNPYVWYHGGHGHLGWTLGAGTSKMFAQEFNRTVLGK